MLVTALACRGLDAEREVTASQDTRASAARGRELYLAHCASCHGEAADGNGVRATRLATPPSDLTRLAGWRRRPERLLDVLARGLPGTDMPAWRALSDEELADLVAYVRSLATSDGARDGANR